MDKDTYQKQRAKLDPWDLEWFDKLYLGTKRPFDGQPHTDAGVRGSQVVEGLRMRDIADCIDLGFFLASGLPKEEWPEHSWQLPLDTMDPVAVRQNAMCNVERMMGIFPNVPGLTVDHE